jgi:exopolysaccharide production protein ExoY
MEFFRETSFERDERLISVSDSLFQKRLLDISLLIVALPLLAPLFLIVSGIVRLVSRGPVIFRQERIGQMGRRFTCYKFRTMRVDAETVVHQQHLSELIRSELPMTKLDNKGDPRLIPFGRLLRAAGLDELPQCLNVLRGEMSLVGPRPCTPYEFQYYLPWQKKRFQVPPGITGLWQVSGKNKTTFTQMAEFDVFYATHHSLRMDLEILMLTFPAVVRQIVGR